MPPKRPGGSAAKAAAALPTPTNSAPVQVIEKNESLRATDEERLATSKSLYGDHKARVSANTHHINDRTRLRAYTTAIQSAMKGKRVLHLGCGMGLMSMLAAKAMASHVVAVDTSVIVQSASIVAKQNKLENITFVQGSLSQGTATLPAEHREFDVILCEWMSSFITNEPAVVKELLYCRDNFLVKGGSICPNQATLGVLGISDYGYHCDTVEYWSNVYGFNMEPMKELVKKEPTGCHIPKHLIKTGMSTVVSLSIDDLKLDADPKSNDGLVLEGDFSITANSKSTLHFLTFYASAFHRDATTPSANFDLASLPAGHNPWNEVSAALPEAIPVFPGDVISGHVKIVPKGTDTEVTLEVHCKNALVDHNSVTVHHFQY